MATESELKALSNNQLPSNSQIPASNHRNVNNAIIEEMFDGQSRGDVLSDIQSSSSLNTNDQVLVIRNGQAYLLDANTFGFVDNFVDLNDVNISNPLNNQAVCYDSTSQKYVVKNVNDLTFGPHTAKEGVTLSSDAEYAPDLSNFGYQQDYKLDANITSLKPINGIAGNYYRIDMLQGTGGTLTLASDWATNASYDFGDLVLVNSTVYICIAVHTSNAISFDNDLSYWRVFIKCSVSIVPLLSSTTGEKDAIILFVVKDDISDSSTSTHEYLLYAEYNV